MSWREDEAHKPIHWILEANVAQTWPTIAIELKMLTQLLRADGPSNVDIDFIRNTLRSICQLLQIDDAVIFVNTKYVK